MRVVVLCTVMLLLAAPARAADPPPEFAAGAQEVLQHKADVPAAQDTTKALKDILAREEFKVAQPLPPGQSLLDRFLAWLQRHLNIGGLAVAGDTATVVAVVVLLLLVTLLIYALVRMLWGRLSQQTYGEGELDEKDLDATGLLELAQRAAAAGEYRTALRLRFKALVLKLGIVDAEHRTNWQLLRQVRREHPGSARGFMELIALFEDCWYGGVPATSVEYSRADELARSVERTLVVMEAAA